MTLETIQSKISIYSNVKIPWDDGLHIDNIKLLLIAKAMKNAYGIG